MVSHMEEYTQKDGLGVLKVFTKPTDKSPGGYFYVNALHKEDIEACSWSVYRDHVSNGFIQKIYPWLVKPKLRIVHMNRVGIDNMYHNLRVVTHLQNLHNRPSRGYIHTADGGFYAKVTTPGGSIRSKRCGTEFEALKYVRDMQERYCLWRWDSLYCAFDDLNEFHVYDYDPLYCFGNYEEHYELQNESYVGYVYSFVRDRSNDRDLLDLERTGVISGEEAIYRYVMRYAADNVWYYYRYNLIRYFEHYKIPVPDFSTDVDGFMTDKVTGKRLCPY